MERWVLFINIEVGSYQVQGTIFRSFAPSSGSNVTQQGLPGSPPGKILSLGIHGGKHKCSCSSEPLTWVELTQIGEFPGCQPRSHVDQEIVEAGISVAKFFHQRVFRMSFIRCVLGPMLLAI